MANNKWTKWIVGLSGAVLFSGFVGYLSREGTAGTVTDRPDLSVQDDFQTNDSGSSSSGSEGWIGHRGPGGFSGDFGGDSGQADSSSGGRMRTRGS